jgi:hypothetical protein
MKRLAVAAAVLASFAAAAHASSASKVDVTAGKNQNECVFIRSVGHYQSIDRDKLVIWAPGRRDAYLVELTMPLLSLEGSWNMAMIDRDRDGRLCGLSSDRISVKGAGMSESSSIRGMTKLSDADLVTLEEQYKVSLTKKKKDEEKQAQE